MKISSPPWEVELTDCHPNKWKVTAVHTFVNSNSTSNFFPDEKQAQAEVDKRNRFWKEHF
jgi:hypothetical protein